MSGDSKSIPDDLRKIMSDFAELMKVTRGAAGEGVRAADSYVRDRPWVVVGVAAAAAFVLGVLVARGNTNDNR